MSYTPGPWRVEWIRATASNDWTSSHCVIAPGNNFRLAILQGYSGTEREANARLMAAAPELLAALKALLPHVLVPGVPMGSEFSRPFPTPEYITNAHAAIKHAEELK